MVILKRHARVGCVVDSLVHNMWNAVLSSLFIIPLRTRETRRLLQDLRYLEGSGIARGGSGGSINRGPRPPGAAKDIKKKLASRIKLAD